MSQNDDQTFFENKIMPGEALKQAREEQSISIEQVATQLHLTKEAISSIEKDDYRNMSAPVYVKGYLKQYAKLVNLPTHMILEAFEENIVIKSKPLDDAPKHAKKKPITTKHPLVRMASFAIITLLILLVVIWWANNKKPSSTIPATLLTTIDEEASTPPNMPGFPKMKTLIKETEITTQPDKTKSFSTEAPSTEKLFELYY